MEWSDWYGGVLRFPVVISVETSTSLTAGTNLGISTLNAIPSRLQTLYSCISTLQSRIRQDNLQGSYYDIGNNNNGIHPIE